MFKNFLRWLFKCRHRHTTAIYKEGPRRDSIGYFETCLDCYTAVPVFKFRGEWYRE